ncbi:MAG: hypothetical protein HN930_05605 [Pelagibacterales bacterium]|nr:hypothetical protein [Pelagibacterales bacterium]
MKSKIQKLPKWFNGTIYEEGETVTNPFSGESYELNNLELSMYDLIIGSQLVEKYDLTRKGLDWFRTNNAEGYMVLLD